ncbi:hypothetical protein [Polynucleobacter sp. Fuers-14]|jgi:hypothetical protein|uniref:hypothetical protein n=1 Tax=Polynucleobacter sp. Fuers-14 TaxID=1758364 RepID=UPI001C0E02EA|nr:hypothetical protein [Polynucleobacter sp. Fuers-14]MBU3642210.1 hypothetical protein [Polynucleobacter sp. Fuers-14]
MKKLLTLLTILFSLNALAQDSASKALWEKYPVLNCKGIEIVDCFDNACQIRASTADWLIKFNDNVIVFDSTLKNLPPNIKLPDSLKGNKFAEKKILSKYFHAYGSGITDKNVIFIDDGREGNFFPTADGGILLALTDVSDFHIDQKGAYKKTISILIHKMLCTPK